MAKRKKPVEEPQPDAPLFGTTWVGGQPAPVSGAQERLSRLYTQISTLTVAVGFTQIPTGTDRIILQASGQNLRWRDDGVAPTATVGMLLAVGDTVVYEEGRVADLLFIEVTASGQLNALLCGPLPYQFGSSVLTADAATISGDSGQYYATGALTADAATCVGAGTFT